MPDVRRTANTESGRGVLDSSWHIALSGRLLVCFACRLVLCHVHDMIANKAFIYSSRLVWNPDRGQGTGERKCDWLLIGGATGSIRRIRDVG
jgi:hypothetical protein